MVQTPVGRGTFVAESCTDCSWQHPKRQVARFAVGTLPVPSLLPLVAVTVDLHAIDVPEDIVVCAAWLASAGVPATFFIPSAMFAMRQYVGPLRELPTFGHELASHTHRHDVAESDALIAGRRPDLGYLELSRRLQEDF